MCTWIGPTLVFKGWLVGGHMCRSGISEQMILTFLCLLLSTLVLLCVCVILPDSLMLRIQSHADLKPARSALFWPQIEACTQT